MPAPNFRLDQHTALVTGAASGIGRAIAVGIAESGANVACFDLPGPGLREVSAQIEAAGVKALPIPGDVTEATSLAEAVSRTQKALGPLTLAVNSAGIANAAPAETMPQEQWQRVLDINVTGVFLSCQAEAQAMLANGRGRVDLLVDGGFTCW